MTTTELIKEIENLPLQKRIFVIEKAINSIRIKESTQIKKAADLLSDDYKNNSDLTDFTKLDFEDFYETR